MTDIRYAIRVAKYRRSRSNRGRVSPAEIRFVTPAFAIFWQVDQVKFRSSACQCSKLSLLYLQHYHSSLLYPSKRQFSFFCILRLFAIIDLLYKQLVTCTEPFHQNLPAQYEDVHHCIDNCWHSYHWSSGYVMTTCCKRRPTLTMRSVCCVLRLPKTEQPRLSQSIKT